MITGKRDYWPTNDWRTVSPDEMGINPDILDEAERAIRVIFKGVNALLIVKNGYLVFEEYYNGFDQHTAHHVASVTKSVTSALIGIAIDKGYIKGVNQKVLDFFPEFVVSGRDVFKKSLNIHHLLTMTAGFKWHWGAHGSEPLFDRLIRSKKWLESTLRLPIKAGTIGTFQYNSALSHLLSGILSRSTKMSARDFANKYLFPPIGAKEIIEDKLFRGAIPLNRDDYSTGVPNWYRDPEGNSNGGFGLLLLPRDMARFGYLYLNGGKWEDKQIISEKWIRDSLKAHTPSYGYQWWLRSVKGIFIYAACGRGGHHIFCVPDKDLIVVVASKQALRWNDRWPLLEKYILPATE
jgi:CubicO group peptidase (beta-lactamase class C family)